MSTTDPIAFKFQPVDEKGNATGLFNQKGRFDGETLDLAKLGQVPADRLLAAAQRFNRLIVNFDNEDGQSAGVVLSISKGSIDDLRRAINRTASERQAARRQAKLHEQGRGGEFRTRPCPHCGSTVDLTGFSDTPQLYCGYCDTIATVEDEPPADEADYRLCDECGLFAKPRDFTVFYFYFLGVIYGWRSSKTHICHACMRKQAWKMLAGNSIFLLGVPTALTQLTRAYAGGSGRSETFRGLDAANASARKGRHAKARERYEPILDRGHPLAGVRYNLALTYAAEERFEDAALELEQTLAECANYAPAATALAGCFQRLGQTENLALLRAEWSDDDADLAAALGEDVASSESSVHEAQ